LGKRTTTAYDAAGRSIASIDPLNQRTTTTYDAASRTIASINPLGQRTSTLYDAGEGGKIVLARSGGVCAFPGCGKCLTEPGTDDDEPAFIGEVTHIVADSCIKIKCCSMFCDEPYTYSFIASKMMPVVSCGCS
jgi:YD repeat-containing protein